MSTATNDVKVIVTADVSGVRPGIDAVNGQLRGMAERAEGVTGETRKMFSGIEAGAMRAKEQVKGLAQTFSVSGGAVDANTGIFSKHAYAIQNASYQLTDFFVQVQNGTRVSVALGQQLPQLLAGFGALGAVAGLVASLAPTVVQAFMDSEGASKSLESAIGDLSKSLGDVGRVARDFSMDKLYEEYNRSSAVTRSAIVDQVEFQRTLIDTQRLLAQQQLSKSLSGIGEYTTMDRLKGAFADSPAEKLSKELGVSVSVAQDLLPAIKGLRDGSEDASNFMARFGASLAASSKGPAQQLVKDIKALADGGRDAAAAQTRLSEALQKMGKAGATGTIALDGKPPKAQPAAKDKADNWSLLNERALNRVDAAQTRAADAMTGFETKNLDRVSALRLEIELLGKSADEVAEAKALAEIDRQFEASRLQVEKYLGAIGDTDGIDRLTGELSRAAQVAKGEMLSAFSELKAKQDALNASWEVGANRALTRYNDQAMDVAGATEQAFTRAFSGMEDALVEFAMTGKLNFSNLANSIISDMIRIQIRASMTQALGGASGGGGLLGALASGVSGLFGNFGTAMTYGTSIGSQQTAMLAAQDAVFNAKGGVYDSPSLSAYSGGVYDRPQLFAFAKGAGVFAEAGPEAIMPLQRDSRGRLGVSASGGTGPQSIRVEIRNEGKPQEVASAQPRFDLEGMVIEVVTRDLANEGTIAKGMQSRYGLSRASGAYG